MAGQQGSHWGALTDGGFLNAIFWIIGSLICPRDAEASVSLSILQSATLDSRPQGTQRFVWF